MTVLVTGANGHVGRHVVTGLTACGVAVRAMSRIASSIPARDGVEVVQGDLTEPRGLTSAMEGVDTLYLFPVPHTAAEVLEQAQRAGVRRVVVLSSSSVSHATSHSGEYHRAVEQAVLATGMEWTFVRPGEFATNVLWKWGQSIRDDDVVRAPYASARQALLHEADVAAVVTVAMTQAGHSGKIYELSGPELLTQPEQVQFLSEAIGRNLRFEEVTPQQAKADLSKQMIEPVVDMVLSYLEHAQHRVAQPLPTVAKLTGRPGLGFREWAADHVDAFL